MLISTKSEAERALGLSRHRQVQRLAETMDEMIRYPIRTAFDDDAMEPCVIAGPSCNSVDVLYEKEPYPLPSVSKSARKC